MIDIIILILSIAISVFVTLIATKSWINIAHKNKLEGRDMNKYNKPIVAEGGGIAVVIGITISILMYVFFKTFILQTMTHLIETFALLLTMFFAALIGFTDNILGWKKGIRQIQKILLTIPVAIPLIVINAGISNMAGIELGLLYPLVIIPIAIVGTTNGFNLLAGYNGLEAGFASIIFAALGIVAFLNGNVWLALIAAIIIASLLAFLVFNKYPSKVFPGDTLTYCMGALISCFAILGNMEKIALILFIPFIIEGFLKARIKFQAENFGIPKKDNSLELPYKKMYSLTHVFIALLKKIKPSHKVYEKDVVNALLISEAILAFIVLIPFL
ncbi:glycosyl transferase family 4 [Candidatus Pacearchaeota archaeon CG06_land_8_20_14_3_00_35_12]|nr:MAG: glycosyl transferase family 4 [Candidatus Pacearchaeota archaeon CG06_land_8_20_14_3_00_35_12]